MKKISKNQEFSNFDKLAAEWWNPRGKFKILHEILPIRMDYILKNIDIKINNSFEILDLGCGGGLTCEPLSRLGAKVTGIDFVPKNIEIAKNHANISALEIEYFSKDLNKIEFKKKYDLVLLLEVIEHLDDWEHLIMKIRKILKPKGKLIISTINKTKLSKIFAIYMAENILKWVPKNTHNYEKLIDLEYLKKILKDNNFKITNISGMNYNPLFKQWKLSKDFHPMNYFCTSEIN